MQIYNVKSNVRVSILMKYINSAVIYFCIRTIPSSFVVVFNGDLKLMGILLVILGSYLI